jgi:hypothetical protein
MNLPAAGGLAATEEGENRQREEPLVSGCPFILSSFFHIAFKQ